MKNIEESEQEKKEKPKGIAIIAIWMMLLIVPGIYRLWKTGLELVISPLATIGWVYYGCILGCAIGLLRSKELARRWTVWLFFIHFIGMLVAVYYLSGPSWKMIIEMQSSNFNMSAESIKVIFVVLIVNYILWQIFTILYLTNPKVKSHFISDR